MTKVWRRYDEHIATCLKGFRFGLEMSDDGMMSVGNEGMFETMLRRIRGSTTSVWWSMTKYDDSITKVWRRYDEYIAICLKVFRSGLVMSDDRRVKFCNCIVDSFFVCSSIVDDLDEAPGWQVFEAFYDATPKIWQRYGEHIAICLKVCTFGLVMSDDGMMNVGN